MLFIHKGKVVFVLALSNSRGSSTLPPWDKIKVEIDDMQIKKKMVDGNVVY
jgi:hypothetical protein